MRLRLLLPVLLAFQAGAPPALAWTWPVDGPVLRAFAYEGDPYAAGQHRGVDLGSPRGSPVVAPAGGVVEFAGTVPGGGRTLTLATGDGYAVTLLHLGSIGVAAGADVAEGAVVGSVGPSGEAEHPVPYVHLGIRLAVDPVGYVDPLALLPPRSGPPSTQEQAGEAEAAAPPAPQAAEAVEAPAPAPAPETSLTAGPTVVTEDVVEARPERAELPPLRVEKRPRTGRDVPSRPAREHTLERKSARSFERPALPRAQLRERAVDPPAAVARPRANRDWTVTAALLLALSALVLARQLGHALLANRASPMLMQLRRASTKDAHPVRAGKDDRVLAHGDLERILLGQAEAFANLDRDDDSAELVDVPHDARRHARDATRAPPRRPSIRRSRCVRSQCSPVIPRPALGVPLQAGSKTRDRELVPK
jgi:peptidase M23-like protein